MEEKRSEGRPAWFWVISLLALVLSSAPYIFGYFNQPRNTLYLGVHWGFDDHAVYAAWAKQAQEGKLLFENRFTTDPQPGLTFQAYFLLIGNIAKLTGIPVAMHIGRLLFGLLFLFALYRLVSRLSRDSFARGVMFSTAIFGAGTGYLYWARYLGDLGMNRPIDVWQPEAFTFPSLMTNGLFCAALWLIVVFWNSLLDARHSARAVIPGFLAILALTNIHTYDTLTIAIVGVGFLASQIAAGNVTGAWLARAGIMALGAVPSLAWFLYVRSKDPVFAARAETVTTSTSLYNVLVGYGPLLLLALLAFYIGRYRKETGESPGYGHTACTMLAALLIALVILQAQTGFTLDQPWLGVAPWLALAAVGVFICAWLRPEVPAYGLMFAWILMGLIALYYPGLFQRKLAMGLSIPIGLMAGASIAWLVERVQKESRTSVAVLAVLVLSITSLRWVERDMYMARDNVTNTLHVVYWPPEVKEILDVLHKQAIPGKSIAIAPPGMWRRETIHSETGATYEEYIVDLPDLNPVLSGWGGVRTYAGHWSETPNYNERRAELMRSIILTEQGGATPEILDAFIRKVKADYVVLSNDGQSAVGKLTPHRTRLVRGHVFSLYAVPKDVGLNDVPE
jgi:hypothetical protein